MAADRIDAGDARYAFHLRRDDPILDRAQIGDPLGLRLEQVAFGGEIRSIRLPARASRLRLFLDERLKLDGPHIDFAQARRNRTHRGRKAWWKKFLRLGQALADLLARKVDIGFFLEDGSDLR